MLPIFLPDTAEQVALGQSAVPLYGPWKFTVGDSPTDPIAGIAGCVPGWSRRATWARRPDCAHAGLMASEPTESGGSSITTACPGAWT
jgi:hypothetical protein